VIHTRRGCNEESWSLINPSCGGATCCCSGSRGAAAEENSASRIFGAKGQPHPTNPHVFADAFRQGLRDLGYMGKNILVDYRYGEGKLDSIPSQVAELVQIKFDVFVL
jgi:hypothetical protein